jgi:hypothetical protein
MENDLNLIVMMETIKMVMGALQIVKFKLDGHAQEDQAQKQVFVYKGILKELI